MRPNCRSSGVATAEAIVSGLAPGSAAPTPEIVGKSTCGSGETGSNKYADRAGQRDRDRQQRRADRPADEGRGEVHARLRRHCSRPRRGDPPMRCAPKRRAPAGRTHR